jgi:hypothetical protein
MDEEERRVRMSNGASVRREMALTIEDFGRTAIRDRARALGVPVDALVSQAVLYYLAQRGGERTATRIPRFTRSDAAPDATLTIELELEESEWSALELASVEERLPVERLVEHIALLFLADIDSGRVAVRIVGEDGEEGR